MFVIIKTFIDDSSFFPLSLFLHKMRDGDQSESVDTKYAFNEHGTTIVWQCNLLGKVSFNLQWK